jgi:hypothetical protein
LKVRLFSDWASSSTLLEEIFGRSLFDPIVSGVEFMDGGDYDFAVVFNFAFDEVTTPPERTIGLVLEPEEILDVMYGGWRTKDLSKVGQYYSFTPLDERFDPVLGIGVPSVRPDVALLSGWEDRPYEACFIASTKTYTPYQRLRREVLSLLLDTDVGIHFYGRGMTTGTDERLRGEIPPGGKGEVLRNYRTVIDFENSPWALTDKFFDAVFSGCVPLTNSLAVRGMGLDPGGFRWVSFNATAGEVVDGILEALRCERAPSGGNFLRFARGDLSLANWITERALDAGRSDPWS